MSENALLVLLVLTVGFWTTIETRAEARLGLNRAAARIVLGIGYVAIFLFYGWLYNTTKR